MHQLIQMCFNIHYNDDGNEAGTHIFYSSIPVREGYHFCFMLYKNVFKNECFTLHCPLSSFIFSVSIQIYSNVHLKINLKIQPLKVHQWSLCTFKIVLKLDFIIKVNCLVYIFCEWGLDLNCSAKGTEEERERERWGEKLIPVYMQRGEPKFH